MRKNSLYAQILYSGFSYEKCRINTQLRKNSYKKTLKIQIDLWQKILGRMEINPFTDGDKDVLNYFDELCREDIKIARNYSVQINLLHKINNNTFYDMQTEINSKKDIIIISLMKELMKELMKLVNHKLFINSNKAYLLIKSLYNLPKYFIYNSKTFEDASTKMELDFHKVINDSFDSMNSKMKKKYERYRSY
ncbi:MAG: hypothetical protein Q8900_03590 [Bacillota bacterium]|nr:hypothetical protein [Bacillota bacterium]